MKWLNRSWHRYCFCLETSNLIYKSYCKHSNKEKWSRLAEPYQVTFVNLFGHFQASKSTQSQQDDHWGGSGSRSSGHNDNTYDGRNNGDTGRGRGSRAIDLPSLEGRFPVAARAQGRHHDRHHHGNFSSVLVSWNGIFAPLKQTSLKQ